MFGFNKMSTYNYICDTSKIIDGLYLASYRAVTIPNFKLYNITHLINITEEFDDKQVMGIIKPENYYRINVEDNVNTDIYPYFRSTYKFIDNAILSGGNVLIHCRMGISRSATLVIAYLMKKFNLTRNAAFSIVSVKRPIVNPNVRFWEEALQKWSNTMYENNYNEMIPNINKTYTKYNKIPHRLGVSVKKLFPMI